ncbi:hypothetical protein PIB30_030611 [Stylosanthes scabra]|uniref:Uncharacterized protein n=1 Tax=Stylosanthes scabra TaxID=79078 RepID=A0ABU6W9P3_9FABA|nr:hypothetical protein [Stylosanthes scabra]
MEPCVHILALGGTPNWQNGHLCVRTYAHATLETGSIWLCPDIVAHATLISYACNTPWRLKRRFYQDKVAPNQPVRLVQPGTGPLTGPSHLKDRKCIQTVKNRIEPTGSVENRRLGRFLKTRPEVKRLLLSTIFDPYPITHNPITTAAQSPTAGYPLALFGGSTAFSRRL